MAYQKTAKDLAWDRERAKLRREAEEWRDKYMKSQAIVSAQEQEMLAYEMENQELRDAIADLTDGKMTPDEVLEHMRKGSQLADMLNFFKSNPLLDRYL
jgi:cell division protein FtsB